MAYIYDSYMGLGARFTGQASGEAPNPPPGVYDASAKMRDIVKANWRVALRGALPMEQIESAIACPWNPDLMQQYRRLYFCSYIRGISDKKRAECKKIVHRAAMDSGLPYTEFQQ